MNEKIELLCSAEMPVWRNLVDVMNNSANTIKKTVLRTKKIFEKNYLGLVGGPASNSKIFYANVPAQCAAQLSEHMGNKNMVTHFFFQEPDDMTKLPAFFMVLGCHPFPETTPIRGMKRMWQQYTSLLQCAQESAWTKFIMFSRLPRHCPETSSCASVKKTTQPTTPRRKTTSQA